METDAQENEEKKEEEKPEKENEEEKAEVRANVFCISCISALLKRCLIFKNNLTLYL